MSTHNLIDDRLRAASREPALVVPRHLVAFARRHIGSLIDRIVSQALVPTHPLTNAPLEAEPARPLTVQDLRDFHALVAETPRCPVPWCRDEATHYVIARVRGAGLPRNGLFCWECANDRELVAWTLFPEEMA